MKSPKITSWISLVFSHSPAFSTEVTSAPLSLGSTSFLSVWHLVGLRQDFSVGKSTAGATSQKRGAVSLNGEGKGKGNESAVQKREPHLVCVWVCVCQWGSVCECMEQLVGICVLDKMVCSLRPYRTRCPFVPAVQHTLINRTRGQEGAYTHTNTHTHINGVWNIIMKRHFRDWWIELLQSNSHFPYQTVNWEGSETKIRKMNQ